MSFPPSTLGEKYPFHHPTMCGGGGGVHCISRSVKVVPISYREVMLCGEGRALLRHPQCVSLYLGWRWGRGSFYPQCVSLYLRWRWGRGSFTSSTVCLHLPWVEVGEGLICIIHSVSPSILGGGGGGAHLHHPQCVSIYLGWRWGRGAFVSSTVCLPLPWVELGVGLIYIVHSVDLSS